LGATPAPSPRRCRVTFPPSFRFPRQVEGKILFDHARRLYRNFRKFSQISRELTHQNPLSFLSIPFKPETNRHPTLTFASLLEDANETDLTGELKHSGFVTGLCGARQGQGQYTQHNQHTGGNLGPDYGSNFPTNYSHDRRSGGAKPPGRHGWRRDEDATLTSLVREVRGFPNHHVPPP